MEYRSTCPLSNVLDLIGDKWSLLIIRDILIKRDTYSKFLESPEKIATNVLVDRLKKLQEYGIIGFRRDPNDKKIKYYYLTESGIDLYPMMVEMMLWSKKHLKHEFHPLSEEFFEEIDLKGKELHEIEVMTKTSLG